MATALGDYMEGLAVISCIGGGGDGACENRLSYEAGVHVVVGTPDSVVGMIRSGALDVASVRQLVLDEADEMLSCSSAVAAAPPTEPNSVHRGAAAPHGFRDQVYEIFRLVPSAAQAILLSSTMTAEIIELMDHFVVRSLPIQILVNRAELTLEGIKQFYVSVEREDEKLDTFCYLYETIAANNRVLPLSSFPVSLSSFSVPLTSFSVPHFFPGASEPQCVLFVVLRRGKHRVPCGLDVGYVWLPHHTAPW
jgi:translation initiation factor 4A